jgi:hypothetical protein
MTNAVLVSWFPRIDQLHFVAVVSNITLQNYSFTPSTLKGQATGSLEMSAVSNIPTWCYTDNRL